MQTWLRGLRHWKKLLRSLRLNGSKRCLRYSMRLIIRRYQLVAVCIVLFGFVIYANRISVYNGRRVGSQPAQREAISVAPSSPAVAVVPSGGSLDITSTVIASGGATS